MRLPSQNTHNFSQVPSALISRSKFDLSMPWKTTFDSGYLVPVYSQMVFPADTINLDLQVFARLATPEVPFMDNLKMTVHFWYVPLRLLQDNFVKLMGEQTNPGDSISYLTPKVTAPVSTGFLQEQLYDYLGMRPGVPGIVVNNYKARAYNFIWNTNYRDENLQNSIVVDKDDGPDDPADYVLRKRGKRKDYFTGCLPFPQKGTAVSIPLGTTAPVISNNTAIVFTQGTDQRGLMMNNGNSTPQWSSNPTVANSAARFYSNQTGLVADLSTATSATINAWRAAIQVQALLETDARGGTRFVELLKAHWNVTVPDFRLQRPEYLGGGTRYVNTTPIAQNSATLDDTTPQGNLAAIGTLSMDKIGFVKSFVEHGIILGLACVYADYTYQQGIRKEDLLSTRYDFPWPAFAHLGEQVVQNQEIFAQGTAGGSADTGVFGYQEQYAWMRYNPGQITALFRSDATGTLDVWHLAQDFPSLPALNATFIEENPPVARVLAVQDEPQILYDSFLHITAARALPVYSTPFNFSRM